MEKPSVQIPGPYFYRQQQTSMFKKKFLTHFFELKKIIEPFSTKLTHFFVLRQ